MKKEIEGKYAIATVISSFRQRYVVPVEALQDLNENFDLDEEFALVWLEEEVMSERVKEFSQHWLGEQVVDTELVTQERILEIFNNDNKYLEGWTEDKKLEWINKWKDEVEKP